MKLPTTSLIHYNFFANVSIKLCKFEHTYIYVVDLIDVDILMVTVDGEKFAGVDIRDFSTIRVFTEIPSRCLAIGHKCSLFSTIK